MPAKTSCASSMTHEVELVRQQQSIAPTLAAGGFATDEEDAIAVEAADARPRLDSIDVEELVELLTPLPEQGLGRDQQDAARPLGHELGLSDLL